MPSLKTLWAFVVVTFVLVQPVRSQTGQPSIHDKQAFRQIIASQISAFQTDDADSAFAFAAPTIKRQVGDARVFMKMVEKQYLPVFSPRRYRFSEVKMIGNTPVQTLVVDGPKGKVWTAYYFFEKQRDSSWKISGVFLKKHKGIGI